MAVITRTSTFTVLEEPRGWNSLSCKTRRSFAWAIGESSPTSSRKILPGLGLFESAAPPRYSPGKRALFVAEQLAFQQRVRHRRAIDLDHGSACPAAVLVYRLCNQFLPCARLPRNEHRRVRIGNLVDQAKNFMDYLGSADYARGRAFGLGEHGLQAAVLLFDPAEIDDLAEQLRNRARIWRASWPISSTW